MAGHTAMCPPTGNKGVCEHGVPATGQMAGGMTGLGAGTMPMPSMATGTTADSELSLLNTVDAVRIVQVPNNPAMPAGATTAATAGATAAATPVTPMQPPTTTGGVGCGIAWQVWALQWMKMRDPVPTRQLYNIVQEPPSSGMAAVLAGIKYDALFVLSSLGGMPLAKFVRKPGKSMLVYDNNDHLIGRVKRHGRMKSKLIIRDASKKETHYFKLSNFTKDWAKLPLHHKKCDENGHERSGGIWKRQGRFQHEATHKGHAYGDASAYDIVLPDGADGNARLLVLAAGLYIDMLWLEKHV